MVKEVCGMKKRFSAEELFELRNMIPIDILIRDVLSIPAKTSEGFFRFLCPICNEFQTSVKPTTNLARCFHCEMNFNTIDITMRVKGTGFLESATFLKDILNTKRHLSQLMGAR
jgi:DNA primase